MNKIYILERAYYYADDNSVIYDNYYTSFDSALKALREWEEQDIKEYAEDYADDEITIKYNIDIEHKSNIDIIFINNYAEVGYEISSLVKGE